MKRIALAFVASLALTAVGCAAANDNSADNSAALSEGDPTTTTTRTISLDLSHDVTNLDCVNNGSGTEDYSVDFDFQGRHYKRTQHIDFWGCQAQRGALSTGIHSGTIADEKSVAGETSTISLDKGQSVFVTTDPNTTSSSTVITFGLRSDTGTPSCRVEMGWFIQFDFRGQRYQAYGADDVFDCQAALALLEQEGPRPTTLFEERHPTFVKRTLSLNTIPGDDKQWVFTSYEQL